MQNLLDLEKNGLKFWPEHIAALERGTSVIPKLIETQDKFISLLNIADSAPDAWKSVVSTSKSMPANLFLKHLMVLADIGGEKTMRFKTELPKLFIRSKMHYIWKGNDYSYIFKTLNANKNWTNTQLKVDGEGLAIAENLTDMMEDIIMLILFGGASLGADIPNEIYEKCNIGGMIGEQIELESFVKQRYIWVSRITGGATSNALGNLAQQYVVNYLKNKLQGWDFSQNKIPDVSQNDRTGTAFDIVVKSPKGKYCAIEVSFQVTTNSTIERKAGQAKSRQEQVNAAGYKIAYIIDGAGNFQRKSALKTICEHSDCTVTFKDSELDKLIIFLNQFEKSK
jgi:DpnII restriction endonuclease